MGFCTACICIQKKATLHAALHSYYKHLLLEEREAEKFPKFKNMLRTNPRMRKGEEIYFGYFTKIMKVVGFPAKFISTTLPTVLCIYTTLFLNSFLS